jgi:polyisoprenyl-teichoic acid--peptidoglycan teichoic acid transferase
MQARSGGTARRRTTPAPPNLGTGWGPQPLAPDRAAVRRRIGAATVLPQDDARGRHASGRGQNFAGVVGWTILGALIPGSGLIAAGRRGAGALLLAVQTAALSAAATYVVLAMRAHPSAKGGGPLATLTALFLPLVTRPKVMQIAVVAIAVLFVVWATILLASHAALRRYATLTMRHQVLCTLLVGSLLAMGGLPTLQALRSVDSTRSALVAMTRNGHSSVNGPKAAQADPWAGTRRVNVLLIGSDAGADRTGIRPDSMTLASIDTQTGATTLFSLPRNLQRVPFPPGTPMQAAYPNGFYCTDNRGNNLDCLLNGFWTFGEQHWKEYYPSAPTKYDAGLMATKQAAEQVTGLPVDQYAMVNLRGFMQFIDAIGGLTLNVYERLPIGGNPENPVASGWIEPGTNQHMDGYRSLWYARSRWSTSDYSRMTRQRCVIAAVKQQASPSKVAFAFPDIMATAKDNVITDIPLDDLAAWVTLTDKVKNAKVQSLPFTDAVISTIHPDFPHIRELVQDAITSTATPTTATPSAATPTHKAGSGSGSTAPSTKDASQAQDVNQVC